MISLMNRVTDSHFNKDPSGRLVFRPFTRKGKCYFVDSQADEDKIRAFVGMYRIPTTLISLLSVPVVMIPGLVLEDYVEPGAPGPQIDRWLWESRAFAG